MAKDLTHVIMEQAMKYGRVLTVKAADAIAVSNAGGGTAQYVHLELRPTDGKPGHITMLPTHAVDGRLLGDEDWKAIIGQMAAELDKKDR